MKAFLPTIILLVNLALVFSQSYDSPLPLLTINRNFTGDYLVLRNLTITNQDTVNGTDIQTSLYNKLANSTDLSFLEYQGILINNESDNADIFLEEIIFDTQESADAALDNTGESDGTTFVSQWGGIILAYSRNTTWGDSSTMIGDWIVIHDYNIQDESDASSFVDSFNTNIIPEKQKLSGFIDYKLVSPDQLAKLITISTFATEDDARNSLDEDSLLITSSFSGQLALENVWVGQIKQRLTGVLDSGDDSGDDGNDGFPTVSPVPSITLL